MSAGQDPEALVHSLPTRPPGRRWSGGVLSVLQPPPTAQRPLQARAGGLRGACHLPQFVSQSGHRAATAGPRWQGSLARGGSALGHRCSPPPPYPRSLQAVKIEAKASCPLLRLSASPEGRGWEGPLGPGSCRSLLAPSVEDPGGRWACLPQKSWGDASPSRLRGSRWGQQAWKDWGRFNQEAARFCGWRCSLWGAPRSVLPESWQTRQRRAGRAGV